MPFSLDKWYLDAASDDGRVVIAYRIDLCLAGLPLRIGSVLERSASGEVSQRSRAGRVPPIERTASGFAWKAPRLDFHACWEAESTPSFDRTLWESGRRSIRWSCLAPSARASIRSGGQSWTGRGYIEQLTTNLLPWRIPIDCLWWGRFTGSRSSLVWIRWDGPHPLTLILADGCEVPGEVHDRGIRAGELTLGIEPGSTLRDGDIASTLLGELPIVDRFAPRARWGTVERKWLCRGTVHRPGSPPETGWVIHERVWFHAQRAEHQEAPA